jgi:hypothetical protein
MKSGLGSHLICLVAGAGVALATPSLALASLGGPVSAGVRADGAGHGASTLQLAAKKKKKKKAGGKKNNSAAPSGGDDSGSSGGGDDAAASSGSGASDADVQRAARVAPPADDSSGSSSDRASSRSKKPTATIEEDGSRSSSGEATAQRFLDVAIGGHGFSRGLTYNQLVKGDLREYQPRLLVGAAANIVYYPGAQFSSGFVTNVGLDVNVAQAFGIQSRTPDTTSYPTQIHDYNGGVRVRLPLDALEPSLTVGFGDSTYSFTGANRAALLLPDVHYQYVRAVVGVHVALPSNFSLFVSAGYRHVLSSGQIKDAYFKSLTVRGAEADAYLAYGITNMIEARLGVDFRRYFYSMHSTNNDAFIAGGAVDQTIAGSLSLAVLLGGSDQPRSSSSSSSSREEAPAASPSSSGDGDSDAPKVKRTKRRVDPNNLE